MSRYDEAKGNLQALYDAAREELLELDKKREEILREIEFLGPICGKKSTYSVESLKAAAPKATRRGRKPSKDVKEKAAEVKSGKSERIKEGRIRELVEKYLGEAAPNSMAATEIFDKLKKEGLPATKSFSTRVYGLLSRWVKEGIMVRAGRGAYKLADK
ncbi:MAG: hypothetical protein II180_07335 [Proteobacteria bacterium]|jgi:hypothetical protein|nr:hypothetical protein [Pseudomonadota bacterium]